MTQEDLITSAFDKQYEDAMKNPPKTLDGHIANENGITNDYRGRAIYEFFQNAIDRAESKIWIHLDKESKRLIIANDGQPFSIEKNNKSDGKSRKYSDFESLCSINTSSKNQNESIGNKGVGFKSCWEYTDKVTICSIHNKVKWGFNLYNPLNIGQLGDFENFPTKVIEWLKKDEYETVINRHGKLPSFYFPERITEVDAFFSDNLPSAATVITFHDLSPESIIDIEKKIGEFSNHQIFFVQQLEKLKDKDVKLELKIDSEIIKELHTKHSEEQWLVVSENFENKAKDKEELVALSENLNYKVENPKIAIAFPLIKGQKVKSKFYCYLPTEVNCGFNVLIHADFLLDVSRKQIDFNNNSYNEKLLKHVAELFAGTFINHQYKDKLFRLDDFAKFINPKDTEEKLKAKVWSFLKGNLMTVLPSVYTNEYKSDNDYSLVFDAMESWIKKHEPHTGWPKYYQDVYDETIKYFCNEKIFIVPSGSTSVSTLPVGDKSKNKLFYKGEDDDSFNVSSDIIKHFGNIAISNFGELNRFSLLRELKIVKPYSTIELVRSLLDKEASEDKNIAVLKFIYQIRDSLYKSKSNELTELLFKIQLPCKEEGDSWKFARQCYFDLDSSLGLLGNDNVYPLDIDRIKKWLTTSGTEDNELNDFLDTLGCWRVLPLRIKGQKAKLPWDKIPQFSDCRIIKDAVNNAIPAKCQPTCRIFVILNLLCKYGGFAPKPPRYFYNGNGIISLRYRLRSRCPSTVMGGLCRLLLNY